MEFPPDIWTTLYTDNVCEQMHKNLKRKIKPKEQFPCTVSLDKAVYCYYADFNARFEDRTMHGFAKCRKELTKMFERVYGDLETEGSAEIPRLLPEAFPENFSGETTG